jgi:replicative superfamily II helicase
MKTNEYPHYQCGFEVFNVVQQAVLPFVDKDVNLVVAFQTAVGKTALAECAFGYHLGKSENSKFLYVSPYKSISEERYAAWRKDPLFKQYGVALYTGDVTTPLSAFKDSRLIVVTSEALDFKTYSPSYRLLFSTVRCVVFDEAHLLGQERRGPCMEAAMVRLSRLCPESRFILLSATLSNGKQLASWLKALNGKETKHITSKWRPVKLRYHYHTPEGTLTKKRKMEMTQEVLMEHGLGRKVLVFVHSKVFGKELVRHLRRAGVSCGFHNASLSANQRRNLEARFNAPESGMNVLVSTSTLSSGVNLGG